MSSRRLLVFVLIFDAVALLILYPHLDAFCCGYLILSTGLAFLQAYVSARFSDSTEIQRLFYSKDIDPAWDKWVALLGLAELGIFFEYAHWRLAPRLVNPGAQGLGLLLCLAGTLWLLWVDSYLVNNFPSHYRGGKLMMGGPYRYVRHPRYVGLLATRLALPLLFGSVISCIVAIAWIFLIRRRARLEERYLRSKFGAVYLQYASHAVGIP
ncbi:MAG: isoprenylcysteine carboxylmethyltransferase family protein [Acidobacteriaceae bacterium]|nr:isoprenylcysteine carboxylmethyltransferase family protein [Acidobacteriaceae bacterium]MBV9778862.1 isoprenylcysteine carboxylmethyltransferase family protein [Acidobacteriaceae bacterium]